MTVLLSGPKYGTWRQQQDSFDQQFLDHCTLGESQLQENYRRFMFEEIRQRLQGRQDLLQQYDPLEVHKLKERDAESQLCRSTAQHQSALTVSFSKEEIQKRARRDKKKKRSASGDPEGAPTIAKKRPPPPIPTKAKKVPPPIPGSKKKAPPPVPSANKKKAPPPVLSANKKKVPPPIPSANKKSPPPVIVQKDQDGDIVMQEVDIDFTSSRVGTWNYMNTSSAEDQRRARTIRSIRFMSENMSETGDGTKLHNEALIEGDTYKATLDRCLVINTITTNARRNRKQSRHTYKIVKTLLHNSFVDVQYESKEPVSPQCYHCERKLKKGKCAVLMASDQEIVHDGSYSGSLFALCTACAKAMEAFHKLAHWEDHYMTRIFCGNEEHIEVIAKETEEARAAVLALFSESFVRIVTVSDIVALIDTPTPNVYQVLIAAKPQTFHT